jgi:hypothetical protein
VDFRFSAENATRQKKHFPEKWISGFPQKMRPGKRSIFRKSGFPVFRRLPVFRGKCDHGKAIQMQSPGQPWGFVHCRARAARITASLPRTHSLATRPYAAGLKAR